MHRALRARFMLRARLTHISALLHSQHNGGTLL